MENFEHYQPAVQVTIVICVAAVIGILIWQFFKTMRNY
jgi:hypothetical protein